MKKIIKSLIAGIFLFLLTQTAFAYSGDLSINEKNIKFSSYNFMEGRGVRIYATVSNLSNKDLLGVVRFFDNDNQINGDQAISLFVGKTDDVFIDFVPSYGSHKIAVKIYPWEPEIDDPNNNWVVTEIFAVQDTDWDGIPNETDEDDDGDSVNDTEDAFPLNPKEQYDTDGDGIGDNADKDDDNDGVPDEFDDLPLDPNETIDTDKDGIGNIADTDDDNDGLTDSEEENLKTDPTNPDTDMDGAIDEKDPFPLDEKEWLDTDKDKIGNNKDTDDDNDGIPDEGDEYPLNKGPVVKLTQDDLTTGVMEKLTLDASPSYDEDGKIVSYIWEIDGEIFEGNSINQTFTKLGKHNIKLTIKDNSGEKRTIQLQANIVNTRLYKQIGASLFAIFLALIIFLKYIAKAKNSEESEKSNK